MSRWLTVELEEITNALESFKGEVAAGASAGYVERGLIKNDAIEPIPSRRIIAWMQFRTVEKSYPGKIVNQNQCQRRVYHF